jgi:polyhydroxyalkanoate synthase
MDPKALDAYTALADFNRKLMESIARPVMHDGVGTNTAELLQSLTAGMNADSTSWMAMQERYYQRQLTLWADMTGSRETPSDEAPMKDRRFRAPEWKEPYYHYLAQSYLLASEWMTEMVEAAQLEPHAKNKLRFFSRQVIDSMSPANFPWSNPEAIRLAAETKGESLVRGLQNLSGDMDRGLVSMTDESAFEVGHNLAVTPGAVVYENDFFQLIQYTPTTTKVCARPLLMVPPCINKFYVLDLQPQNSLVKYAVDQGHTVFMVSWRNMPESMGRASWDDYVEQGVIRAIGVAREIGRTPQINVLGFCVGGTLLGCALAVLRAKGEDPAASVTLLATMLDFRDTGELSVFVDAPYVEKREQDFANGGLVHGRELAITFASLRANDLIWPYVVNNYLKGRTPEPFDLLYWNSDSTNLPGVMYAYYIRNMYLENSLREPGRLTMCGAPVDLGNIDCPAYVVATREDHIVPWKTAYASGRLPGGRTTFVLGASGHIAGVINPASANRRSYWTGDDMPPDADDWLSTAVSTPGSWWSHWSSWLAAHGSGTRGARKKPGNRKYAAIEAAPGRYVREKIR